MQTKKAAEEISRCFYFALSLNIKHIFEINLWQHQKYLFILLFLKLCFRGRLQLKPFVLSNSRIKSIVLGPLSAPFNADTLPYKSAQTIHVQPGCWVLLTSTHKGHLMNLEDNIHLPLNSAQCSFSPLLVCLPNQGNLLNDRVIEPVSLTVLGPQRAPLHCTVI